MESLVEIGRAIAGMLSRRRDLSFRKVAAWRTDRFFGRWSVSRVFKPCRRKPVRNVGKEHTGM